MNVPGEASISAQGKSASPSNLKVILIPYKNPGYKLLTVGLDKLVALKLNVKQTPNSWLNSGTPPSLLMMLQSAVGIPPFTSQSLMKTDG